MKRMSASAERRPAGQGNTWDSAVGAIRQNLSDPEWALIEPLLPCGVPATAVDLGFLRGPLIFVEEACAVPQLAREP